MQKKAHKLYAETQQASFRTQDQISKAAALILPLCSHFSGFEKNCFSENGYMYEIINK